MSTAEKIALVAEYRAAYFAKSTSVTEHQDNISRAAAILSTIGNYIGWDLTKVKDDDLRGHLAGYMSGEW